MDKFTRTVLAVIACALVAIAVKMWMPGYATFGELQNAFKTEAGPERDAAFAAWRSRLVMVRMQGGTVDVDITRVP